MDKEFTANENTAAEELDNVYGGSCEAPDNKWCRKCSDMVIFEEAEVDGKKVKKCPNCGEIIG